MTRLQRVLQEQREGPLLGVGTCFYDPIFLEIAAGLGFRAAWFDMEHCLISFDQACDLCRIASGLGLLTMIRVPNAHRENVQRAVECGPDIIDIPMADTPEILHEFIRHARFRPEGERGCFPNSRAVRYGLTDSVAEQERVNRDLCLMAQIETAAAVERAEELCAVPGIHILIGPADLSSSLGVPYQTGHPKVREAGKKIIRAVRKNGKLVAVASSPADFAFWIQQGVDVLFCTSDVGCLKTGAQTALQQVHAAMSDLRPPTSDLRSKVEN
jgi:2-keto-3-deoxy-L-rhamnonate aldolase RhmA